MGFFRTTPEETTSREYLALAPPGSRAEVLGASCTLQTAEMDVAQPNCFGQAATIEVLDPVSQLVRRIMRQDRDLSAGIARKAITHFEAVVGAALPGDFSANMALALRAVGLRDAPEAKFDFDLIDGAATLSDEDRDGTTAIAGMAMMVLRAYFFAKDGDHDSAEWRFYSTLFTGAPDIDAESLAYDITAWVSLALARLLAGGHLTKRLPFFEPAYREAPVMHRPGWYPNPTKIGGIVQGDAAFQRYWDQQWTDNVRIRDGRGWKTGRVSLHDPPVD